MSRGILKRGILNAGNDISNTIIKEVTSEEVESSKNLESVSENMTPSQRPRKRLQISTSRFGLGTPTKNINSAMLPPKQLKFQNINKFKRMSTIGLHRFNKSMANEFEFKDLKELARKSESEIMPMNFNRKVVKLHGRSLFIFGKKNKFRKLIKRIVDHRWFDFFIIINIIVSSITLAIENPLTDPNSQLSRNLAWVNNTMTIIF